MSLHFRNTLLLYYAPITTIGGTNSVTGAIGIVSKYKAMVVTYPANPADTQNLLRVILGVKTVNPNFKVFGYTDFGNAADIATWEASVQNWTTALPTGYLDGIFLDKFSYDYALSTRANQVAAVTFLQGLNLSSFACGSNELDLLGQLPGDTAPQLGRSTTVRDYVLLNGFFYNDDNSATPTLQPKEQLYGRLQFLSSARLNPATSVPYNLGFGISVGAGTAAQMIADAYEAATVLAAEYNIDYTAVTPYDRGNPSNRYFFRFRANTFTD